MKENLEFALFKLQSNTEEICTLTSVEDKKKCYELFNENKETANIKINKKEEKYWLGRAHSWDLVKRWKWWIDNLLEIKILVLCIG